MDINRRKFIKILLIGGASFIVGKTLGPLYSKFFDNTPVVKNDSTLFKIVENAKELSIFDSSGEEIFQIDKGV